MLGRHGLLRVHRFNLKIGEMLVLATGACTAVTRRPNRYQTHSNRDGLPSGSGGPDRLDDIPCGVVPRLGQGLAQPRH